MNVRISYAVDLEQVPEKMAEMLNQLNTNDLDHLLGLAIQMIDLGNLEMGNALLDQVRTKLAAMDRSLNDTQMILGGYINAKSPQEPAPAGSEVPENAD